jgi:uncharacterized protein (DUF1800 family)
VGKLYGWLISENGPPDDALLAPLVESFAKDHDVGKLVERMLRSNLFFSSAAYRGRIKSPVEFAVGIIAAFETLLPTMPLGQQLAALGQDLCHPPTVHGWEGGRRWITRATLLARSNLAYSLLSDGKPFSAAINPQAVAEKHGQHGFAVAGRFALDLLLQGDVPRDLADLLLHSEPDAGDLPSRLRRLVHAVVALPEFQLA